MGIKIQDECPFLSKLNVPRKIEERLELLELRHVPVEAGLGQGRGVEPAVEDVRHFAEVHALVVAPRHLLLCPLDVLAADRIPGRLGGGWCGGGVLGGGVTFVITPDPDQ